MILNKNNFKRQWFKTTKINLYIKEENIQIEKKITQQNFIAIIQD